MNTVAANPNHLSPDSDRFFKGWAKPGVEVPGGVEVEPGETLDWLAGNFRIFQYSDGHRFSTDDVLVAWYGTSWCPSASRCLDLGSGIGSVGMVAAWRLPNAKFVTVEAQDISVQLARKSARFNGIESRYEIRQGDFRDPTILGAEERFDLITGSPPYFPLGTGVLGNHPQKVACRFEVRGSIADYCLTAAKHLNWGGFFASIFPDVQDDRVLEAARAAGLSIVRSKPLILREGDAPLLRLYGMVRSDHLPENFRAVHLREPALLIRQRDGLSHPEYSALKMAIGLRP